MCDGENHVVSDESPDGAPVLTEVVTVKTNVSKVNVRCTIDRTRVLLPYLSTNIILNVVYILFLFKINYIDDRPATRYRLPVSDTDFGVF